MSGCHRIVMYQRIISLPNWDGTLMNKNYESYWSKILLKWNKCQTQPTVAVSLAVGVSLRLKTPCFLTRWRNSWDRTRTLRSRTRPLTTPPPCSLSLVRSPWMQWRVGVCPNRRVGVEGRLTCTHLIPPRTSLWCLSPPQASWLQVCVCVCVHAWMFVNQLTLLMNFKRKFWGIVINRHASLTVFECKSFFFMRTHKIS